MTQNFSFILRKDYLTATGENNIYFRLYQNRKTRYLSTNISTLAKYWDARNHRVRSGDKNSAFKNKSLEILYSRAQTIHLNSLMSSNPISISGFLEQMKNEYNSTHSFFDFANQVIKEKKSAVGASTHRNYFFQVNKLKAFKNEFTLSDIDLSFIRRYETHLKTTLKNNENTTMKSLTFLRMICNEALKHDLLAKTPFRNYKIKEIQGKEDFLTFKELEKLEKLYEAETLHPSRQNVLRYFLFACYTGVAHGDLSNLKYKDVKKIEFGEKSFYMLDNERIKTGNRYRVPLLKKALDLAGRKFADHQKLFKVLTNQPTNRYLKEIAAKCGIDRNITFHISRHTFGTHMTTYGIPQNLLMEMMGHKDMKVNRIYSKIQDETLFNAMEKNMSQVIKSAS